MDNNSNSELNLNSSPRTERSQDDAADAISLTQPILSDMDPSRDGISVGTEKAEALSAIIEERRGAVEAARAIGQLNADWLVRIHEVGQQLDNVYRSEISSTELSYKEKAKRAKDYVTSLSELSDMIHTASQDYLQCNGIYRDRLSPLAEMTSGNVAGSVTTEKEKTEEQLEEEFKTIGRQLKAVKLAPRFEKKVAGSAGPPSSDNSTRRQVAKAMAEMMVEKDERYGIPLPEEIELPAIDDPDTQNAEEE